MRYIAGATITVMPDSEEEADLRARSEDLDARLAQAERLVAAAQQAGLDPDAMPLLRRLADRLDAEGAALVADADALDIRPAG
jgi:hypothetical protein